MNPPNFDPQDIDLIVEDIDALREALGYAYGDGPDDEIGTDDLSELVGFEYGDERDDFF